MRINSIVKQTWHDNPGLAIKKPLASPNKDRTASARENLSPAYYFDTSDWVKIIFECVRKFLIGWEWTHPGPKPNGGQVTWSRVTFTLAWDQLTWKKGIKIIKLHWVFDLSFTGESVLYIWSVLWFVLMYHCCLERIRININRKCPKNHRLILAFKIIKLG